VLLRVLERQPVSPDSALTWNLLRTAEASDVGPQALLAQELYFMRRLDDRLRRTVHGASEEPAEPPPDPEEIDRAGLMAFTPLVSPLALQVAEGGALAAAALKVLARVRTHDSLDQIALAGEEALLRPYAMAALATYGGPEAAQVSLEILDLELQRISPMVPALLPALRGVPTPETLGCLKALAPYPAMHAGVAAALEGFGSLDYEPVLEPLLASQDPWVLLQTIETLVRLPRDRRGDALSRLFRRVDIPAVRLSCLQAIAEVRSAPDAEVALEALSSKVPLVRAAAIEAVLVLPIPRSEFHDRVLDLLDDPHPRVAMNAAKACVSLDSNIAVKRVHELLASGSPANVAQAVHCLVRLSGRGVAPLFVAVIDQAPPGALLLQTVRALGRRARRDPQAVEGLVQVLGHPDANVRTTAAWFLAGSCDDARGEAAAALAEALEQEESPAVRAVCAEALGLCGTIAQPLAPCLVPCLDAEEAVARAAAWSLATAFPRTDASRALDRPDWARMALLRNWYRGNVDMERLGAWIESEDIDAAMEALEIAGSMAGGVELMGSGHPRLGDIEVALMAALRAQEASGAPLDLVASQGRTREELVAALAAMAHLPDGESFADAAAPVSLPEEEVEALAAFAPDTEEAGEVPSYYEAGVAPPPEEPAGIDLGASRPGVAGLDSIIRMSEATSRSMLRRKVREALENSVRPTVIPQAVRERAEQDRKRRAKARREARRRAGPPPATPEELAADRAQMRRVLGSGLAVMFGMGILGYALGGGPPPAPPPRPTKRPPLDRPGLDKPPPTRKPGPTPTASPSSAPEVKPTVSLESLRMGDTSRENFQARWELMRSWAEAQSAQVQRDVVGIPQLAKVRIRHRSDPDKAARMLDDLIEKALKAGDG
jgi:HEAT repeat protein